MGQAHCPHSAFVITDLSFPSFILLLFNTSSVPPANMRHAVGKLCQGWVQKGNDTLTHTVMCMSVSDQSMILKETISVSPAHNKDYSHYAP